VPEDLSQPHQCANAISHCPPGTTNSEMVELCELGPPSFFKPSETSDHIFRNSFCLECWRDRESELKTSTYESYDPLLNYTIVSLHPIIQYGTKSNLDFLLYSSVHQPLYKELFGQLNDNSWYAYNVSLDSMEETEFSWDLGSIRCDSEFPEVCANFVKFPEDEGACSGPGCGNNNVQDAFGSCLNPTVYEYSDEWRKEVEYVSPEWLLMRYNNLCSSEGDKSCQ